MTPDDMFRLEQIGDVALSPDGEWLAYVVKRAPSANRMHKLDFLLDNDIADIWLVRTKGGTPENITRGLLDGSGYWSPSWSPDGKRIAMLSTEGGNVRLWVWDRATKSLRRLTDRAVVQDQRVIWVSDTRLICSVLPEGEKPRNVVIETQVADVAIREWPKTWAGQESTASVLESGVSDSYEKRPQGQVLLIDTASQTQKVIASGNIIEAVLSPNKSLVALVKQTGIVRPEPDQLLPTPEMRRKYGLVVASILEGPSVASTPKEDLNVYPGTVRWSPDSTQLSLVGSHSASITDTYSTPLSLPGVGLLSTRVTIRVMAAPVFFRYRVADNFVEPVAADTLRPLADGFSSRNYFFWTKYNELLCLALPKEFSSKVGGPSRTDWWLVRSREAPKNLTCEMKSVPGQLIPEADGESFVGVADGKLWRINSKGVWNLTEGLDIKIGAIVWPSRQATPIEAQLIVTTSNRQAPAFCLVNLRSRQLTPIAKPAPEAILSDYSKSNGTLVFTAKTRNGTYLWTLQPPDYQPHTTLELNTFLKNIIAKPLSKFEYRSSDGENLTGWILLPDKYQAGLRYPLVTVVYAGDTQEYRSSTTLLQSTGQQNHALNWQLLAAHGYAVLFPSMPLKPMGEASDPLLELTKGVLPAVDKVIEMGIADPERLGLIGQSYGGYSVYGLVTQTNRFRSAIVMSGMSNLVSLYGSLEGRFRYEPFGQEQLTNQTHAEIRQFRMGNPPWKDIGRYLRNSPIFYVDRVETPVMIIHGDMDHIPIQQAEEFFMSLYRQNKRAKFVRYWGEGHVLRSPANIRDLWTRIYEWFDEYLMKPNN